MSRAGSISVGWCTGKDCRKTDRDGSLRGVVAERCDLVELKCLDLCDGPVLVVRPDADDALVFRKVRKRAVVRDIVDHATEGTPLSAAAEKRRVTGRSRANALRRVEPRR